MPESVIYYLHAYKYYIKIASSTLSYVHTKTQNCRVLHDGTFHQSMLECVLTLRYQNSENSLKKVEVIYNELTSPLVELLNKPKFPYFAIF